MEMIAKDHIEKKMREILYNNHDFKYMRYDVPSKEVQDFIRYETLKELLEEK